MAMCNNAIITISILVRYVVCVYKKKFVNDVFKTRQLFEIIYARFTFDTFPYNKKIKSTFNIFYYVLIIGVILITDIFLSVSLFVAVA